MKLPFKNRKPLLLVILIVLNIILFSIIIKIYLTQNTPKPETSETPNESTSNEETNADSNVEDVEIDPVTAILERDCETDPVIFTHPFTDPAGISHISPLGGFRGGSAGRSYVALPKDSAMVNVYAPTTAVLDVVIYAPRGPGVPPEYGLYFEAGCGVTFLLDHLDAVSPEILAYTPLEPAESTASQYGTNPQVVISAGTLLAFTDGTSLAQTFDFLVLDDNNPDFHINPERWTWEQYTYAQCPYDYYTDELKAQYYALLGEPAGAGEFVSADCGSPSSDVLGTISGGWFKPNGTTQDRWLGITDGVYWIEFVIRENGSVAFALSDYDTAVKAVDINPGDKICFKGYQGTWAYLYLVSDTELRTVTGTGNCPSTFPTTGVEVWER